MSTAFRSLPSVDEVAVALAGRFPHGLIVSETRRILGECRERIQHLTECVFVALREDGHFAQPVLVEQKFAAAGVVEDVDHDHVNAVFRKKLFRSQAATSSRLGEVHVLVGVNFHCFTFLRDVYRAKKSIAILGEYLGAE